MRILGIDLGSRAVKIAVLENSEIVDKHLFETADFYRKYCHMDSGVLTVDFDKLGLGGFDSIGATGYGRNNVKLKDALVINELKAHTQGAVYQTGISNFTLLDIGGQDSKVMHVINGIMNDMVLNDKCAASCGRFLENMAVVLGISIDELTQYGEDPVELNSTCAVFGESELIGRISEGYPVSRLAAGVNYSLFMRIKPMLERYNEDILVITGGVAQNPALVGFFARELSFAEVVIPEEPQFNGAIGCCVFLNN